MSPCPSLALSRAVKCKLALATSFQPGVGYFLAEAALGVGSGVFFPFFLTQCFPGLTEGFILVSFVLPFVHCLEGHSSNLFSGVEGTHIAPSIITLSGCFFSGCSFFKGSGKALDYSYLSLHCFSFCIFVNLVGDAVDHVLIACEVLDPGIYFCIEDEGVKWGTQFLCLLKGFFVEVTFVAFLSLRS